MSQKIVRPQPGPQEMFLASPADVVIFGGSAGGGKLLSLDTPVPTPSGWTTMGALKEGDIVFDERGALTRVVAAHPVDPSPVSYRVRFDDSEEIVAGADHQWLTFDYRELCALTKRTDFRRAARRAKRISRVGGRKSAKFSQSLAARNRAFPPPAKEPPEGTIRTTRQIAETLLVRETRRNHAIPVSAPLQLPDTPLPLDPYLLGCWLGDGSKSSGIMACGDPDAPEIIGAFAAAGFYTKKYKAPCAWAIHGLLPVLRRLGIFNDKHVPPQYLRASRAQRLALLQGLMDTDGSASTEGDVAFGTTSPALRDAVVELAHSLGWKVGVCEKRARVNGKDCGPCWQLSWSPTDYVFRLKRKAARQRLEHRRTTRFRYVVACDRVDSVPMRCIEVDSPSHLYLAGRGMVPTHNSFSLLVEPLRYVAKSTFNAVIFRRTYPELYNVGGLWPESKNIYLDLRYGGAAPEPKETTLEWVFPSGARVKFAHMQHEEDRFSWKGAQIPLIEFDQLEMFTRDQFWYMFSRNRDATGTCRPYVRASVNPAPSDDPIGGWVADLIAWWIDQETGLPIEERSGVLRWFARVDEEIVWASSPEELLAEYPKIPPKSFTFIRSNLADNKILMANDPGYVGNLMALPMVERERLLNGNWKIRASAGKVFNEAWFRVVPFAPAKARRVRYWDKAGGEKKKSAYSVGVKMSVGENGIFFVEDVVRGKWSPLQRNDIVRATAALDGPEIEIWLEQEPGSGGLESAQQSIRELAGYNVHAETVSGDKVTRAAGLSAQAEKGNVVLVSAGWNRAYLSELHSFPDGLRDQVDASSGAFNKLTLRGGFAITTMGPGVEAPRRRTIVRA